MSGATKPSVLSLIGDAMLRLIQAKQSGTEDEARKAMNLFTVSSPDLFHWLKRVMAPKHGDRCEVNGNAYVYMAPSKEYRKSPVGDRTVYYGTMPQFSDAVKKAVSSVVYEAGGSATARPDATKHTRTCPAYGNYQPPYEDCNCVQPTKLCVHDYDEKRCPHCAQRPTDLHISVLDKIRVIATMAHALQKGKYADAGRPYIEHVERVVALVKDNDAKAVAWLHDVLEDTWVTKAMLVSLGVPSHIITAVEILTKREDDDYVEYIERIKENQNRLATAVKIADLRDHLRPDGVLGIPRWKQCVYATALKTLIGRG